MTNPLSFRTTRGAFADASAGVYAALRCDWLTTARRVEVFHSLGTVAGGGVRVALFNTIPGALPRFWLPAGFRSFRDITLNRSASS